MKTEQVNMRLEADLIAALEEAAREESLDRGTIIRKLLLRGLAQRRIDRALERYQVGEISMGRAAEDAGLTHWEILEQVRRRGIAYPLDPAEAGMRLEALPLRPPRVAESGPAYGHRRTGARPGKKPPHRSDSLPDRPPRPGGVLLVGINPATISALAGHYYQGKLGRRIWRRLEGLGLLEHPVPGEEDEAFVAAGHGLTDVVQRATATAEELSADELRRGAVALQEKVRAWRPGLILFAFKGAASAATGVRGLEAGSGPALERVPTFLLNGPYASRDIAKRIDGEARRLLARLRRGERHGRGGGRA